MIFAELRTLAIKLLQKKKTKNYVAQVELFQDDFATLFKWLRDIRFL